MNNHDRLGMNISTLIGFGVAALVLWFGVLHSTPNPKLFLDPHALILVCGGTLAAALIAFPIKKLIGFFDFFISGVLLKKNLKTVVIGEQIFRSYEMHKANHMDQLVNESGFHPFLVESVKMISRHQFEDHELEEILETRIESIKTAYLNDAKMLNALAKFPPAFGLLGASTGMIVMMTRLGSGGAETIGPAMAIALVATFWGIAVANLVFLPLSDYANKVALDEARQRKMIADSVRAMNKKCSIAFLTEITLGHLPMSDRMKFKERVRNFLIEKKEQMEMAGTQIIPITSDTTNNKVA
ncbi:MAG: MotA/TolQ/ExbB proton channel family protein [Deltaproteobacteria bacterium]|nr:MotA/TolQ/ExbB proton channel family protein [Deltaproteobacteria bacterium]